MSLERQFKENYRKYGGLEMNFNPTIGLEEIAENFAIGFGKWLSDNNTNEGTIEQLLELYKKTL